MSKICPCQVHFSITSRESFLTFLEKNKEITPGFLSHVFNMNSCKPVLCMRQTLVNNYSLRWWEPTPWFLTSIILLKLLARTHKEEYCCLGHDARYTSRSLPLFWRNILPPSSGLKSKPNKQEARIKQRLCLLCASYFLLVGHFVYSLTLKAEPVHSSDISVSFYWTTQQHIPDMNTLQTATKL
jgi:hypothetical protein